MASLGSRIKSAAKKTVSKVKSSVSNLSKQATALKKSLSPSTSKVSASTRSPYKSYAPTMTSVVTKKPAVTAPTMTSAVTKRPATASTAPKMSTFSTKPSGSSGRAYNEQGVAVASTIRPGSSRVSSSSGSSRSSDGLLAGVSSGLSGAYNAMRSAMGKDSSQAASVSIGTAPWATQDSYKSTPGYSTSSYSPGQSMSLEAQSQRSANMANPIATPASRQASQAIVSQWDSSAPQREAQAAALQAQMSVADQEKAARDAVLNAAPPVLEGQEEDPIIAQLRQEEANYQKQYEAMQREVEKLTKPSAEYLAAQREEERLTAEEQAIKAGLDKSVHEIKGQPIPQGFLTGQAARQVDLANVGLNRVAGQKVTLQEKLANLQQRRMAALDVVKGKLADVGSRLNRTSDRAFDYQTNKERDRKEDERYEREQADKREQNRYKTIGDGAQLYDTVTGKIVENTKNYAPARSGGGGGGSSSGGGTALDQLLASRNQGPEADGQYADPNLFVRLRAQSSMAPSTFNGKYGYLINPASRSWVLGDSGRKP